MKRIYVVGCKDQSACSWVSHSDDLSLSPNGSFYSYVLKMVFIGHILFKLYIISDHWLMTVNENCSDFMYKSLRNMKIAVLWNSPIDNFH